MPGNDIGPRIGIDGEATFKKSISAINAQLKSMEAEGKALEARFKGMGDSEDALAAKSENLGKSIQAAQSKLSLLDDQLTRQKEKLAGLGTALDQAAQEFGANSVQAVKAQNAYNQQSAAVSKLERDYFNTQAQIERFKNAMSGAADEAKQTTASFGAMDLLTANAAWDSIKAGATAAAEAIGACIQTTMEFDSSMADVAATMGVTVDSLGGLREFAQDMGATTAFTANEAAQALNYMALAGYDADEAMGALPNVLNLAAAGSVDLAAASDMVTDAQSALGLTMEETERLVDQIAKTSTKTNTSVAQLGEAILTVGGTAQFMAGGTRELNQVLGLLADNSIKGAEGGTKLRNIILSLTSPTEAAASTLDDLGVSVFDAEGNLRQFSQIFPELEAAMAGLTDEAKLNAIASIFNTRDIAAAQALLGTATERWKELDGAIANAAGSAQSMAETKLDNLAGDITLLQSAADGAKLAIGDALTPALRETAQAATNVVTAIGNVLHDFPLLSQAAAGVTAGVAALTIGVGAYTAATTLGTTAVAAFSAALTATPLGWAALAIGGVVTAVAAFSAAADEATDKNEAFLASIQQTKEALSENVESAQQSGDTLRGMADAIIHLSEVENMTSVQHQALLNMISQLNAAIPGLNLAYDEQTGKLNMTAQAVRDLTQAESDRLVAQEAVKTYNDLLTQQQMIAQELAQAEVELEEARAKNAASQKEVIVNGEKVIKLNQDAVKAQSEAAKRVGELRNQYDALQDELDLIEAEYGDLSEAADDTSDAIDSAAGAAADAAGTFGELESELAALEASTLFLTGANQTLSDALREQSESGSLSLNTALDLIDAGYAAALAIDTETGSITLNESAYIALATAKIDEQIATLEVERSSLAAAEALYQEASAADRVGSAYWQAAKDKAAFAMADAGADLASLEAQIAALNETRNALGSGGGGGGGSRSRSGGGGGGGRSAAQREAEDAEKAQKEAQRQQEQAQREAEQAEKERQRQFEEDSKRAAQAQKDYYDGLIKGAEQLIKQEKLTLAEQVVVWEEVLAQLGKGSDQYLKTEEKIFDLREKIQSDYYDGLIKDTKQVIQHEKKSLSEQYSIWTDLLSVMEEGSEQYLQIQEDLYDLQWEIREDFADKVKESNDKILELEENYQDELQNRVREIVNSYGLFDEVPEKQKINGALLIRNLREQTQSVEQFYADLAALEARGVAPEMIEEIRAMGVDAGDELAAILDMSDEQLTEYSRLFGVRQSQANEYALEELEGLREETDAKIQETMGDINALYEENAAVLGKNFTSEMAHGIRDGMEDVAQAATDEEPDAKIQETMDDIDALYEENAAVLGEGFTSGMAQSIRDGMDNVAQAATDVAQAAIDAARSVMSPDMLQAITGTSNGLSVGSMPGIDRDVEALMPVSNARISAREMGNMISGAVNALNTANTQGVAQPANITLVTRDGLEIARGFLPDIRRADREDPEVKND